MKKWLKIAGVSPATVSRVLRSPQMVRDSTRQRVEDHQRKIRLSRLSRRSFPAAFGKHRIDSPSTIGSIS
ncbi:MAG: LacI family DNA-binding transcriptional regulator [Deltaproteobacteria bacterium]|nr:LacI family DNA-binding transcriptional regulator [Deltaproteobacteria bacterium]